MKKFFTVHGYVQNSHIITSDKDYLISSSIPNKLEKQYYTICKSIFCYRIIKVC